MPRRRMLPFLLLPCLALAFCVSAEGQRGHADLSDAEVEAIREATMEPAQRVLVFQKLIDVRMERMQRVLVDVRAQGRAEDLHTYMDQVSGLVNELEDDLDEYAAAHRDVRKPLPKLVTATERWQSILRQPPANDTYKVTRSLALEAVADLKDDAARLLPEQERWFKEHPPSKEPPPSQYEVREPAPRPR